MKKEKTQFKRGEWSLLGKFYLSTFIDSAFALIPLLFILYFEFKGFKLGLGGYLLAVSGIFGFFFEIPTGVVADVFGRKISTLFHYVFMGAIALAIPFATQPYMLYILFALEGIAITFRTGAKHAWIVDNLKHHKRDDLIQSYYTKSQSILAVAIFIAGLLLSGILFLKPATKPMVLFGFDFIGADLLWFIEGLAYLSIFILLLSIEENYKPKKAKLKQQIKEFSKTLKYGLSYSWKHPIIFVLLVNALLFTISGNMKFVSFQPYLIGNGIKVEQFGYLSSAFLLLGMLLPFISQRLTKNIRKNVYLAITSVVKFVFTLGLYFIVGPVFTIVFWFVHKNFYYLVGSIENSYFQEHVTSKGRATIGSIENAMYSLGSFIGPLIGGLLINYLAPRAVLAISSFLIIPAIFMYLRIK